MIVWLEKLGKKKVFILLLLITLTVGILISIYVNNSMNRLEYKDHTYKVDRFDTGIWHLNSDHGPKISVYNEEGTRSVDTMMGIMTIELDQDKYKYYRDDHLNMIIELNGLIIETNRLSSIEGVDSVDAKFIKEVIELIENKRLAGILFLLMFNFILMPLGCLNIVFPEFSWHLKMLFITRGGEPTGFYMMMTRISGFIIVGFALFYPLKFL